jgi:CubicO group peptidase (beta-lactamase class C family)
VTLRELLSHQSGVRGYADEEKVLFSTVHYPTSRDALKVMMTYSLAVSPGTKVEYSSLAFTVLGAAAEAATGRSFQQLSIDFFSRYGIPGFALDDPYAIVPRRVHGYLVDRSLNLQFNDGRVAGRDYLRGTNGKSQMPITTTSAIAIQPGALMLRRKTFCAS